MDNDSSVIQLVQALRADVQKLRPGDRLPGSRELVESHRMSPVSVSRALAVLVAEGLIVTRPGSGTFVAPTKPPRRPIDHDWQTVALADRQIDVRGLIPIADVGVDEDVISLGMAYPHSSLMPTRALTVAFSRAARLADAWERPPANGLHGLRSWFAQIASPDVEANDVIITPGGQAAISAAFRALVPPGSPLLMESPTYPGALAIARAAGIRPVPVPVDAGGVNVELLAEAFDRTGAQAFYCQPTFQNPTGSVLHPDRRAAVLAAAAAAGAFVIEDDYAHWMAHSRRSPVPLLMDDAEGRVVYITSLTKIASPGLRIGALIARGPVANRLRSIRVVDDMFVPRPAQEAALELVSKPSWEHHLRTFAAALHERSAALIAVLSDRLPGVELVSRPTGGMHLWVRLPSSLDDEEVTLAARRAGVIVGGGRHFFPAEAPGPYLRLSFSSVASIAELDVGIARLASVAPELSRPA
jgi:DNA-binding transcriptional MocR family regulator